MNKFKLFLTDLKILINTVLISLNFNIQHIQHTQHTQYTQ